MAVAVRVAECVASLMETQDRDGEEESDEPALAALYGASIQGRIATGPNVRNIPLCDGGRLQRPCRSKHTSA